MWMCSTAIESCGLWIDLSDTCLKSSGVINYVGDIKASRVEPSGRSHGGDELWVIPLNRNGKGSVTYRVIGS